MNNIFGKMFELLFKSETITAELNNNPDVQGTYLVLGLVMLILSILLPFIFYFAMDKARYAGFKFWFIWLVSLIVLVFGFTVIYTRSALKSGGMLEIPMSPLLYLGAVVTLYGIFIYFITSIILKRFTTSLVRSPL